MSDTVRGMDDWSPADREDELGIVGEEEEEEKPLPCPFCGSRCAVGGVSIHCTSNECGYEFWREGASGEELVADHNRVARAVMEAKKEASK